MGALPHAKGAPAPAAAPFPANDEGQAAEAGNRALLRFITCGSVDDGKSTLIGRILYEAGAVFDDQLGALDADSRKFGTQGAAPDFALLVDGLSAEREQGITIDVAYRYFSTPQRSFIVADTPGHEQYTRNMATGASTADLAIILVDARKGLLPQTRRHSFIVSLVGVRHIVVAVNKMDLVGYDEEVFRAIERDYRALVAGLGFASIDFIPVSARDGENVTTTSRLTPWYSGPALLPYLEEVAVAAASDSEAGFSLPVQWVNRPNLDFRGYSGMLAEGRVRVGQEVTVLPSGRRSRIAGILAPSGEVSQASAGQSVTLSLADEVDASRGDVIAAAEAPPSVRQSAEARLLWTGEAALRDGADYILKLATATANVTVERLHHGVDIETFAQVEIETLPMNAIGLVSLRFDRPLAVRDYRASHELGGFILIDRLANQTVAFGFIETPDRSAETSAARPVAGAASGIAQLLGQAGSSERRARLAALSWALVSAAAVAAAIWAVTGQERAALLIGAWDLLLRPLLRAGNAWLWRRRVRPEAVTDGAGI